jgi:hypothetical protein
MERIMSTLHVASVWLVMTALAVVLVIVLPFIFGGIASKQLGVGWKYF